ncbi:MAG: hypothetical protein ACKOUR_00455 [Planctomycetota bacterium]
MNPRRSFQRKVAYGATIALLLFPLFYLGHPATQDSSGGQLAQMRTTYRLSQGNLGDIDPASETMKLATLGMRPFATVILWEKANEFKKKKDWDNLAATLNQIIKLDPNILSVWEFQAHNLSYNVSVEFDDYRHRYQWVKKGIEFLMEGTHYNRDDPKLLHNVGWFIGHKMGRSDEKLQFRRLFRRDIDFHNALQESGEVKVDEADAQGPQGDPDSWLVSRVWYLKAEQAANKGQSLRGKSPLLLYADGPMARINFSMQIEEEGVLDEKAQIAWEKAGEDWRAYGDRTIPHSTGHLLRLNDVKTLVSERAELQAKLDEAAPGVREALRKERWEALNDEQRRLLESNPKELNAMDAGWVKEEGPKLLNVSTFEIVEGAPDESRARARKIAERLIDIENRTLAHAGAYRNQVNYDYWETRCAMEQTEAAVTARRNLYEAEKFMDEADPDAARKAFEAAWDGWAEVLTKYPELKQDLTIQDLGEAMEKYYAVLRQLDLKIPADFKLMELWERYAKVRNVTVPPPTQK